MESEHNLDEQDVATDLRWSPREEGEFYLSKDGEVFHTKEEKDPVSGRVVVISELVGDETDFRKKGFGIVKGNQAKSTAEQPATEDVRAPVFAEINLDKSDEQAE